MRLSCFNAAFAASVSIVSRQWLRRGKDKVIQLRTMSTHLSCFQVLFWFVFQRLALIKSHVNAVKQQRSTAHAKTWLFNYMRQEVNYRRVPVSRPTMMSLSTWRGHTPTATRKCTAATPAPTPTSPMASPTATSGTHCQVGENYSVTSLWKLQSQQRKLRMTRGNKDHFLSIQLC